MTRVRMTSRVREARRSAGSARVSFTEALKFISALPPDSLAVFLDIWSR